MYESTRVEFLEVVGENQQPSYCSNLDYTFTDLSGLSIYLYVETQQIYFLEVLDDFESGVYEITITANSIDFSLKAVTNLTIIIEYSCNDT